MEVPPAKKNRLEQLDDKLEYYKSILDFICDEMMKDKPEKRIFLETAFQSVFKLYETRAQEKLELNKAANVVFDMDKEVPPKKDSVTEKPEKPLDNDQAAVSGEIDMESNKNQEMSPKIDLVAESPKIDLVAESDKAQRQGETEIDMESNKNQEMSPKIDLVAESDEAQRQGETEIDMESNKNQEMSPKIDLVAESDEAQRQAETEIDMESNKNQEMSLKFDLDAEADKAQLRGDAFLVKGEYEKAIVEYIRAIELNPDSASGYYKRAFAFCLLNMNQLCLIDCNRVIQLDPEHKAVYGLLGMAYVHLEMLPQAQEAYAQALMFEPDNKFYSDTYQLLEEKLQQIESVKGARTLELRYLAERYELFKKDDDIIAAAILLLHEPSASNITSIMIQNDHSEQQSNVINTLQYLQKHNEEIYVPLYRMPLEHQIEKYDEKEQKNKKKDTKGKQKLRK